MPTNHVRYVAQKAELVERPRRESQGVEKGLVYFSAKDMKSDQHGVAHGDFASVTTCERPRAGYHSPDGPSTSSPAIDRHHQSGAVAGRGAVFFLPRVVIPLRTVSDERQRPQFFPDLGYNQCSRLLRPRAFRVSDTISITTAITRSSSTPNKV